MKTMYLSLICLFATVLVFGGTGAYQKAMQKNLQKMHAAQDKSALLEAANGFERIANNEPTEWLPLYYAAYSYINLSHIEEGISAKDEVLDKALTYIRKASELAPQESEIVALEGYQVMMKLAADPASRGQSLSPKAMQLFGKAMEMNPENPRAIYLMSEMEYGSAKFFGSGTEKACALSNKSIELFDMETAPETIEPNWGKEYALRITKECSSKE